MIQHLVPRKESKFRGILWIGGFWLVGSESESTFGTRERKYTWRNTDEERNNIWWPRKKANVEEYPKFLCVTDYSAGYYMVDPNINAVSLYADVVVYNMYWQWENLEVETTRLNCYLGKALLLKFINENTQGGRSEQKEWKTCLAFLDFSNVLSPS